jgi:uroporphyrinogen decarboxylase
MQLTTSKQRVLLAASHQDTDRVPVDYYVRRDVTLRLMKYLSLNTVEELYVKLGIDIRKISVNEVNPQFELKANGILGGSSEKSGKRYIMHADGTYEDAWGVVFKPGRDGLYDQWIRGPFAETMDLDAYIWPDMDIFESVEEIKKRVGSYGGRYALMGTINLPFKVSWFMRGFENYLCDMMIDPGFAKELSMRNAAYEREKGIRLIKAGVDIIGIMEGMIKDFRKLNPDILMLYHSDGDLSEVLDDLIEIGITIINPIQPECMDVIKVKKKYGDRITMHGTISIQRTLPNGTVEDVRCEVMDRIRDCGENGGLVICPANHVQNDTPLENLLEVYRAAGSFIEG